MNTTTSELLLEYGQFFLEAICPTVILFISIIGNILIIIIFSRKSISKKLPVNMLRLLSLVEVVAVLTIYKIYDTAFNLHMFDTRFVCQLYVIHLYVSSAYGNWLLAIVNIERMAYILNWVRWINVFKKQSFQIIAPIILLIVEIGCYFQLAYTTTVGWVFIYYTN